MKFDEIKWLFFDLGSTLINEDEVVRYQMEKLLGLSAKTGNSMNYSEILQNIENSVKEYAPKVFDKTIRMIARTEEEYFNFIDQTRYNHDFEEIYPDSKETLEKLCNKYSLGIIANQKEGSEKRLENFGIKKYFSICLSSSEIGLRKPDLQIFELALKQAKCEPSKAVMIGDRLENDVYPAKKIGMRTIRILRGISKVQVPKNAEYEPDFTIYELKELFSIL